VAHPVLPHPPDQRHRLQGVRLAGPAPLPPAGVPVQRRVFSRGGIMVATQKIQAGMTHAGKTVTVTAENNNFRLVIDGETIAVVPRTTTRESTVTRPTQPAPEGGDHIPGVMLNASDAAELAQLLQFLSGWLSHDPGHLGASLASFVGQLRRQPRLRHRAARGPGPLRLPARRRRRRIPLRPSTAITPMTRASGQPRIRRALPAYPPKAWHPCQTPETVKHHLKPAASTISWAQAIL
jgi:hypothetical protein